MLAIVRAGLAREPVSGTLASLTIFASNARSYTQLLLGNEYWAPSRTPLEGQRWVMVLRRV